MRQKCIFRVATSLSFYRRFSSSATSYKNSIFTSIEPNGPMHLGNYFAAIKVCVDQQNSGQHVICSIGDMLSIALTPKLSQLPENILLITACLIGCGLRPEDSTLFLQSQIPHHSQFCWVLGCLTDLNELPRSRKDEQVGVYLRPLMQTSDRLLYGCQDVCIGYEKSRELLLTHYLARKFEDKYGVTFHVPNLLLNDTNIANIRNLRKPAEKMSKSAQIKGVVYLTDSPDAMFLKIKKAVTDMTSAVTYDPETRPGVSNLVSIHSAVTGRSPEDLCQEAVNLDTGMYKLRVAEALIETVKPIHAKINDLLADKSYLVSILQDGAVTASHLANQTWISVRQKIGSYVVCK